MNITSRLCNATNKDVVVDWHAGISIRVPADGFVDLGVNQFDDFRPGKAGSEEVQQLMDGFGIFLRDVDLPYEVQALDCLKRCLKAKKTQYTEAANMLSSRRAQAGHNDTPEKIQELLRQLNFEQLADQIKSIEARIKFYDQHVSPVERKSIRERINPETHIPWTNPPKNFETKLQCQMWLEEQGEEAQKRHKAWVEANVG